MQSAVASARRVVVKVGSALVTNDGRGLDREAIEKWATQISALQHDGKQVILVSSGAVAEGVLRLGWEKRPSRICEVQAAAAVGQIELSSLYQEILEIKKIKAAQVLLTQDNADNEHTFINAVATLKTLLEMDVVPIINENDTVSSEEIKFGDNDRLSAIVSQMTGADVLLLLSDVDGLYEHDPKLDPKAKFIPVVRRITPDIEAMASNSKSTLGTGGMKSKLMAAQMCMGIGCDMVISAGKELYPLRRLLNGEKCTWFLHGEK